MISNFLKFFILQGIFQINFEFIKASTGEIIPRTPIENFIKQVSMANHQSELTRNAHQIEMITSLSVLENLRSKMEKISTNGGLVGAYDYTGANLELPILIGSFAPCEGDQMAPILDVEICDDSSLRPIYGLMSDLFSGEEKPIELGESSVCIETSEEGKVIGAKRNIQTGTIVED